MFGFFKKNKPQKKEYIQSESADKLFSTGSRYHSGITIDGRYIQDDGMALFHFREAAEQGHVLAMIMIGHFYEQGISVDIDTDTAIEWYTKSANKGSNHALYRLGVMFELGENGVSKSFQKAQAYYREIVITGDDLDLEMIENVIASQLFYAQSKDDFEHSIKQVSKAIDLGSKYAIMLNKWVDLLEITENDYENSVTKNNDCLTKPLALRWAVSIENVINQGIEFNSKGWVFWQPITKYKGIDKVNIEQEKSVNWVKAGWRYFPESAQDDSPWIPIIDFCKAQGLVIVFKYLNNSEGDYEEEKNNPNSFYNKPGWTWSLRTVADALDQHSEPELYQENIAEKNDRDMFGAFNTRDTPNDHPLSPVIEEMTNDNWKDVLHRWGVNL